jgi:hypothetical protein
LIGLGDSTIFSWAGCHKQSRASREQDATTLSKARDARRKSEAINEKAIGDITNLVRAMNSAMAGLGVSLGPRTPEMLVEEVGRLPGVVHQLKLSTAHRAMHRLLAMFESYYQGLDRMALRGRRRTAPALLVTWPTLL